MLKRVYVFIYPPGELEAVPAGILEYDTIERVGKFTYGTLYSQKIDAIAVDPIQLPLGKFIDPTSENNGLYGAIRDASPDYWGRLVIADSLHAPVESVDEIQFLLESNASRVGNLDFRSELTDREKLYSPPSFQHLEALLTASDRLQRSESVSDDLRQLLKQGTSMGGARPKCCVEVDGSLWIAKFPARNDSWSNAKVEMATMSLAARCGINTPEMRTIDIGGRDVLLVNRFDRAPAPGGFSRIGFLSALSFSQWDESDKHEFSYPTIAAKMRQAIAEPRAAMANLYQRMIYNIFCRNTDDHPRNHGFLVRGTRLDLSPAYDITPTPARAGVGSSFNLAMGVGPEGRWATLANALKSAPQFGLTREAATSLIVQMSQKVAAWTDVFEQSGVVPQDIDRFRHTFGSPALEAAKALSK